MKLQVVEPVHKGTKQRVALIDDDGEHRFVDVLDLSREQERSRFAKLITRKFPELKGREVEQRLFHLYQEVIDKGQAQTSVEEPLRDSQANRIVRLVEERGISLFHSDTKTPFARVPMEGHWEIWKVRGKQFRQWAAREFWQVEGRTSNNEAINSALNVIEGKCLFEGRECPIHNRVASHNGSFWYDLADGKWRAVEISPAGWRVVDDLPILFQRYAHQRAQAEPMQRGDARRLLRFTNVGDEDQRLLLMVYIASCFIPDIPHPIAHGHGEKGTAKTTLLRLIRSLVDPSVEEVLTFPRDINELLQKLSHHWLAPFDNLSSIPDWISDALSWTVTGAGFSKREFYSDEDDVIFAFRRCVCLNGINVVATKPDLLDRAILFNLERIPPNRRKEERILVDEFEAEKPSILGGFFDILSKAMVVYPTLQLEGLPRMADFARWGCAIAEALGYKHDDFLRAYAGNARSQNLEVISSHPLASTLFAFMEDREMWQGSPAELLHELERVAEKTKVKTNVKAWPGGPHILTRRLKELKGNLRDEGINVDDLPRTGTEGRRIGILKADPKSLQNGVTSVTDVTLATRSGDDIKIQRETPTPIATPVGVCKRASGLYEVTVVTVVTLGSPMLQEDMC